MERKYLWRFQGGGILPFDGMKIWPGRTFTATPSQIPEEFRDRVVRVGPPAVKPAPPESVVEAAKEEETDTTADSQVEVETPAASMA